MRHDYYYYNKEELLRDPKIQLIVMDDNQQVFKSMADEMVEEIKRKNALGRPPFLSARLVRLASIHILWTWSMSRTSV